MNDLDKYNLCEHCVFLQHEHVGSMKQCLFASTCFVKRKRRNSHGDVHLNRDGIEIDWLVPLRRIPAGR